MNTDTVWVISWSEATNDDLMACLTGVGRDLGRPVRFERAALDSADPRRSRPPDTTEFGRLVAVVLIVESEALDEPAFVRAARACVHAGMDNAAFRLLVLSDQLTNDELLRAAEHGNEFVADLIETIQLSSQSDGRSVRRDLLEHLRQVDDLRSAGRWRDRQLRLDGVVGRLAGWAEVAGGVLLVVASVVLVINEQWLTLWLPDGPRSVVGAVGAAIGIPLISGPLNIAVRGRSGLGLLGQEPVLALGLGVSLMLAAAALAIPLMMGISWAWAGLGLSVGILLEAARRSGRRARAIRFSFRSVREDAQVVSRVATLARAALQTPLTPFSGPLLTPPRQHVFISYARSSAWSRGAADELHRSLEAHGVSSFLDRLSIATGANWQRVLAEGIAAATVFVALLDSDAMRRPWLGAEMLAALSVRAATNQPHILVLMDQVPRDAGVDRRRQPVFDHLLGLGAPFRVRPYNTAELARLAHAVSSQRGADMAVLPPMMSRIVGAAVTPLALLAWLAVAPAGVVSWLVAALQIWEKYDSAALLGELGLLDMACVTAGVMVGFGLRSFVAKRARWARPPALFSIPGDLLMVAGHVVLLMAWLPQVESLAVGWSLTAAGCGAIGADLLYGRIRQGGEA